MEDRAAQQLSGRQYVYVDPLVRRITRISAAAAERVLVGFL